MVGEADFIKRYLAPLASASAGALDLKDDAAIFIPTPSYDLVFSKDLLVEGVHFLGSNSPEDVAFKCLSVNLSDLAAKGAIPKGFMLGLSFARAPSDVWAQKFTSSLRAISEEFGCPLLGGDTTGSKSGLTISITIIGEVKSGQMVRRSTGNVGDHIFLSGTIGDAALGLELLQNPPRAQELQLEPSDVDYLVGRYNRPTPRNSLSPLLLKYASASMDVSDGVYHDLPKLCDASGVSASVELQALPFSVSFRRAMESQPGLRDLSLTWGDDFEILACIPAGKSALFLDEAKLLGCDVCCIGSLTQGSAGPVYCDINGEKIGITQKNFAHF